MPGDVPGHPGWGAPGCAATGCTGCMTGKAASAIGRTAASLAWSRWRRSASTAARYAGGGVPGGGGGLTWAATADASRAPRSSLAAGCKS